MLYDRSSAWTPKYGKASHAPWRIPSVSPTPKGEGAGEAFFVGMYRIMEKIEKWVECFKNYEVSNLGRVRRSSPGRRTFKGRVLSPIAMSIGYFSVKPVIEGKNRQCYIHDLVAQAFIGPKPDGSSVNHIDGNKKNNNASNLEYTSHAENMSHAGSHGLMARGEDHPASKMTNQSVKQLRSDRISGMSFLKLSAKYGIAIMTAHSIVNRKYWSHVE